MAWKRLAPVREKPPCAGCARDGKRPGCHDRCAEYKEWKAQVAAVNQKRKEYSVLPPLTKKERKYGK